jgi:transposase, IS30 family
MKTYKRLTPEERDRIAVLRARKKTWRQIGKVLGRSHTTLMREWRRNKKKGQYGPLAAQRKAEKRQRVRHRRLRLGSRVRQEEVERMIMDGWSPEIAAGRINFEAKRHVMSHEAIYQWIYAEAPHLAEYLLRHHSRRRPKGPRRAKRVIIPQRIPLDKRPAQANDRTQPGHWESDLMVGEGRAAIQSSVERISRKTHLRRIPNKTANESRKALHGVLSSLPQDLRRSVTYDNGTENTEHHLLNQELPGLSSFFCAPYHSWEKGAIENRNGIVRRFLPKGTRFEDLSDEQIQAIEDWINNRPMKCLGFQTPNEVFALWLGAMAA